MIGIWVFLICTIILIIGYPVVSVKLIKSIYRKEKAEIKKNTIWLGILLIFSGFVFGKIPGSKIFWWPVEVIESKIFTKSLTGKSFVLPEPIFEWDSPRAFNGDGSSIAIYELKESVNQYFLFPDTLFFENFPEKGIRDDWEINKWTNTPIKPEHIEAFNFAYSVENSSSFDLEELLNENGNYYSFKYYLHSFSEELIHYGNVDFYIVCPKKNILVEINHNT